MFEEHLTTLCMADFEGDLDNTIKFLKRIKKKYHQYSIVLKPNYEDGDIDVYGISTVTQECS